jgi:ATP-binding cassette subfamily B protein
VTLSGGQKQRTAIARMLTQKAPIMVFDDSLSAVDSETDAKIRQALRQNLGDSTVILISHRVTTLMQAEKIMVLDKGRIAEIGSHEELMAKNGIYRKIYDLQFSLDETSENM